MFLRQMTDLKAVTGTLIFFVGGFAVKGYASICSDNTGGGFYVELH